MAKSKPTRLTNSIRVLRFAHGEMTQAQLAERIGVTRQTILAIEQGPAFAAQAADGSIGGVVSQAAFCFGYAALARQGVAAALVAGTLAYAASATALVAQPSAMKRSIIVLTALCMANIGSIGHSA